MVKYDLVKTEDVKKGFSSLWEIVNYLRDPKDGCPWDKEQTPKDIIRSMQGEIYEYIDALSEGDKKHQMEEIGDVFLNLFLLLKIQDQNGDYKASEALNEANEKYIRRHPHVFSDVNVTNSAEVISNWQDIKKNIEGRKENADDFFNNIERNAPELERCYKISKKAAKAGFEWPDIKGVFDKVYEELDEVKNAGTSDELEDELGDVLFTVVNLCRRYHIKPQDALHKANSKFIRRFNIVYSLANEKHKKLEELSASEYDELWNKAKERLKDSL